MTSFLTRNSGRQRQPALDETPGLEDTEDLPLSPDEDMPVIPDEERVIDVPS